MAEMKVSELTEASEINDSDLIMIVQGGVNKKITKQNCQFASGDEIFVGDEPVGGYPDSIKLVFDDDDTVEAEGSYISNDYGTSQAIGYSQEFINGDVLYNNTTGTTGNVQLSNSIDNYRYLEIFYVSSGYQNSLKVDLSIDKTIILNRPFIYNGAYYDRMSKYNIAGSTITYSECLTINNNFQSVQAGTPEIIIKKVIGYK